jgi:hypothetical protein
MLQCGHIARAIPKGAGAGEKDRIAGGFAALVNARLIVHGPDGAATIAPDRWDRCDKRGTGPATQQDAQSECD